MRRHAGGAARVVGLRALATWVAAFTMLAACGSSDPATGAPANSVSPGSPDATTAETTPAVAPAITPASTAGTTITAAPSPASAPTSSTATSTSTTAPTTTIDPLGPTRDAYSASDKAHDAALLAATERYAGGGPMGGVLWENVPPLCVEQAAIDLQWASEVAGLAWPADLQVYADELVIALTLRSDAFTQCSLLGGSYFDQAPNFDAQDAAYRAVDDARKAVRRHLGLGLGE